MHELLKDKVVVVTGGAGLLGKAFVRAIALAAGKPVIADIDLEAARRCADELFRETGVRFDARAVDITSRSSVVALFDELLKQYGKIDAVVNNAYPRNKQYGSRFEEVTYESFCENMNMHAGGYFLMCQQAAIFFARQGWGNIINMASVYGVIAPRFEVYEHTSMTMPVEYAAIKSAVIHLSKYIAKYYAGRNIRCNAISPGGIAAGQAGSFLERYRAHCLNTGMLASADISGTLLFLLSDSSKAINGQNIIVDDGFTL